MKKIYKSLLALITVVVFSFILNSFIQRKEYIGLQSIMRGLSRNNQIVGVFSALIILTIGFLFIGLINTSLSTEEVCLLAFPTGCFVWIVIGCIILYTGIPYNILTICLTILLVFGAEIAISHFIHLPLKRIDITKLVNGIILYLSVIIFASNGLLYTFNNGDSHYFIELLGASLINEGGLITGFVPLLSETSLGLAVLAGLPYCLGLDNMFVIHHTLMITFIALFARL